MDYRIATIDDLQLHGAEDSQCQNCRANWRSSLLLGDQLGGGAQSDTGIHQVGNH
jgi:hypothetical protein